MTTSERQTKSFSTTVSSLPSAGKDFQSVVNQDLLKAYTVLQGQLFEYWGNCGFKLHSLEPLVNTYRQALNGIAYTDLLTLRYTWEIPLTKIDVQTSQLFVSVLNQIQLQHFSQRQIPTVRPNKATDFEILDDYWVEAIPIEYGATDAAYERYKKEKSG